MPRASGQRPAILMIDDDEVLRGLACDFLVRAGYRVYQAGSGEEAIEIFSQHVEEIGLVITDMGLPGMGGGELLLKIRDMKPEINSIAISGFGGEEMQHQVQASKASAFIPKPFNREDLLKIVESYLLPEKHDLW